MLLAASVAIGAIWFGCVGLILFDKCLNPDELEPSNDPGYERATRDAVETSEMRLFFGTKPSSTALGVTRVIEKEE